MCALDVQRGALEMVTTNLSFYRRRHSRAWKEDHPRSARPVALTAWLALERPWEAPEHRLLGPTPRICGSGVGPANP